MQTWPTGPGVLELPDGRRVRGGPWRKPRTGEPAELSVVLTAGRPRPTYERELSWVRWPDFWLPASTATAVQMLTTAHRRAQDRRVEICCGSGVGRTGTALAFLAVLGGPGAADAVF